MRKIAKKLQDSSELEVARLIARAALDKKAEDVVILDVNGLCSFADYFVIMSGRSTRHVQGLASAVDEALGNKRIKQSSIEGLNEGLWVLIDYVGVVVHVFYKETREFYQLERLWHDAPQVGLDAAEEIHAAP